MSSAEPSARPLAGRVAVVTGPARGIGRAAAVALAAAGAAVAGLDVAGPVSPILYFAPATPEDLAETGRLLRVFAPLLVRRGGGRIIAVWQHRPGQDRHEQTRGE
jgi:hypothetical protein